MGSSRCLLVLVVMVLALVAAPSANAQLGGLFSSLLSVPARIVCSANGNPCTNATAPLANVTGNLICNGQLVGSAVSNVNGIIFINVLNINGPLLTQLLAAVGSTLSPICSLVVPLANNNLNLCPVLQGLQGNLTAPVTILNPLLPATSLPLINVSILVSIVLPFVLVV